MTNVREIPLSKGLFAIVDAADYDWLMQWKWRVMKGCNTYYAIRNPQLENGKYAHFRMRRVILGAKPGTEVDHRDCNGLNNTRENLRAATPHQNSCNRLMSKHNTSGYKGVTWHGRGQRWQAQIQVNGKSHYLGLFECAEDAARAYNEAALLLHGEFARLNHGVQP